MLMITKPDQVADLTKFAKNSLTIFCKFSKKSHFLLGTLLPTLTLEFSNFSKFCDFSSFSQFLVLRANLHICVERNKNHFCDYMTSEPARLAEIPVLWCREQEIFQVITLVGWPDK